MLGMFQILLILRACLNPVSLANYAALIGGVPNMNLSAVRFIRAFRTGMLGYFVLDDYKREPLLAALHAMQREG